MTFKEWYLKEGVQIVHIDPEDDWEQADQAYQIAKLAKIRPDSTKNPTILALNDRVVMGRLYFFSHDQDALEPRANLFLSGILM